MRKLLLVLGILWEPVVSGDVNAQASQSSPRNMTEDLTVEVHREGRVVTLIPEWGLVIDTARVQVKQGETVKLLLRGRGIRPDSHAIGLFYRLNPQVSNANALAVGSSVLVPTIIHSDGEPSGSRALTYAIITDTTYKAAIDDHAARISELGNKLSESREGTTENALGTESIAIASAAKRITNSSIPLDPGTRERVESDLTVYQSQINGAVAGTANLDSVRSSARVVAADLSVHASAADKGKNHLAQFEFTVVDTTGLDRAPVVIICAIPLIPTDATRQVRIYKDKAGPKIWSLDAGPWLVWVEDLNGNDISTKHLPIDVRGNPDADRAALIIH
jgi:hypothetical protein